LSVTGKFTQFADNYDFGTILPREPDGGHRALAEF